MTIRTHIAAPGGGKCAKCGILLPVPPDGIPLKTGELVGLLETTWTPHSSYRIGDKDSNRRCG